MHGKEKYYHIVDRETEKWTSFGKFHNKPPRTTLIKDLSDSHLMRIVVWIKDANDHAINRGNVFSRVYSDELLKFMQDEVEYRTRNHIFVPEYIEEPIY